MNTAIIYTLPPSDGYWLQAVATANTVTLGGIVTSGAAPPPPPPGSYQGPQTLSLARSLRLGL